MKRKWLRSEAGTSMIEFALIAPVLLFLVIGLIDVGRYTFDAILAANAARAGVQYGAQSPSTAEDTNGISTAALNDAQNLSDFSAHPSCLYSVSGGALQTCTAVTPTAGTTYYVKVTVTGTFKSLFNYPGIPNNVPVTGSAIMRVINQ